MIVKKVKDAKQKELATRKEFGVYSGPPCHIDRFVLNKFWMMVNIPLRPGW